MEIQFLVFKCPIWGAYYSTVIHEVLQNIYHKAHFKLAIMSGEIRFHVVHCIYEV
jgi:hypothetical protein